MELRCRKGITENRKESEDEISLLKMVVACSSFSWSYGGMGGSSADTKTSVWGFRTISNWN